MPQDQVPEASPSEMLIERKKALQERKEGLEARLRKLETFRRGLYLFALALVVVGGLLVMFAPHFVHILVSAQEAGSNQSAVRLRELAGGATVSYGLMAFVFGRQLPIEALRKERIDVVNELDLLSISSQSQEQKAQKLLRIQQLELDRYYDQILRQSSGIFYVGVASLALGFVIIACTLYYVGYGLSNSGTPNPEIFGEKIIVATVGAVGGILTNFVGALYMKMFSEIVATVGKSRESLVGTYQLHLANLLVSQIEDQTLRHKTLSDLALTLEGPKVAAK